MNTIVSCDTTPPSWTNSRLEMFSHLTLSRADEDVDSVDLVQGKLELVVLLSLSFAGVLPRLIIAILINIDKASDDQY